jgi:hypothetical protein
VEAPCQGHRLGAQLHMRLAPFTLPFLLANALAGVAQRGDQTVVSTTDKGYRPSDEGKSTEFAFQKLPLLLT